MMLRQEPCDRLTVALAELAAVQCGGLPLDETTVRWMLDLRNARRLLTGLDRSAVLAPLVLQRTGFSRETTDGMNSQGWGSDSCMESPHRRQNRSPSRALCR